MIQVSSQWNGSHYESRPSVRLKTSRHKVEITPSPHPHTLFLNLTQILTPPTANSLPHFYIFIYRKIRYWQKIASSQNWIREHKEKYFPYTMFLNRRYHVCFNLRKIGYHNNLIPNYASLFTYPNSFTWFIFKHLYRAARYFTDEYKEKVFRLNGYIKMFSFGICKFDHSIHAKYNALFRFDVNL
jgi:hypothetical protein